MSERWIVITSIHPTTAALRRVGELCQARGWNAVMVADEQTPADWHCPGVELLSQADQRERYGALAEAIPSRHYSRKNLGYLHGMQRGARMIVDLDDDNVPLPHFGQQLEVEIARGRLLRHRGWVNVYSHFGPTPAGVVWPRGLPLDAIHTTGTLATLPVPARCPIQQFLADGDPDVDAIHRLTTPGEICFDPAAAPVVLDRGCWSPFNSQNTVFFEEAFPLLYLPSFVSFRMTDIWRSLVAQAALWQSGARVCFHAPTVRQQRNPHELTRDFEQEVPGYLHNRSLAEALDAELAAMPPASPMTEVVVRLWEAMVRTAVVPKRELTLLNAWLAALVPSPGNPEGIKLAR